EGLGIVYTRTGRRFFEDARLEQEMLAVLRAALDRCGFWEELGTDWTCLDCELMPWSAKAQALLRQQYAALGAAARGALPLAVETLRQAAGRGAAGADSGRENDLTALLERHQRRLEDAERFVAAYRRYCWPVESIAELKLAPFHLLATEGAVHADKDHIWHMETLARLCGVDPGLLLATPYRVVDLHDPASREEATAWWQAMTDAGGEGMVLKPYDMVAGAGRGLVQPAVKCRGREYLRLIYGPEYDEPEHLERLRARALGAKRGLAIREFALGLEALERFVRREALSRVHECVFGVLALESEPVDPRL
ncbi:MAG TPA: polynucleotide kinase-phosphatase, partial [Chloroflexota bacterium]|nr:polynucleotide kinase-phosphatase [Chloroflexota bacterium]